MKRAARPGRVGRVRASDREPDPDEQMARRFAALGPGGPAALAALWARPRLRPVAWLVLDGIEHARTRIARGRREYGRDHAARDSGRKARLPRVLVLDMTEPPPGWTLRRPGVLVRVRPEGARPLSFRLGRGQSVEADVLADLRERLAALGVPPHGVASLPRPEHARGERGAKSRGKMTLLAALVALARP